MLNMKPISQKSFDINYKECHDLARLTKMFNIFFSFYEDEIMVLQSIYEDKVEITENKYRYIHNDMKHILLEGFISSEN